MGEFFMMFFFFTLPFILHFCLILFSFQHPTTKYIFDPTIKMASSVPGDRPLPASRYNLNTYWGRVQHCAEVSDPR